MMFVEPAGSYDICGICYWEDDVVQLAFPDLAGGANTCSLIEGQIAFARHGACEQRVLAHVRPAHSQDCRESSWRPLDVVSDRYLHCGNRSDEDLWQTVKDSSQICLYYWRPDYWLAMERCELLVVEDTFWIDRNAVGMLIIQPNFSVPKRGWQGCTETVVVRRPDGQEFEATAQLELTHFNIRDPQVSLDQRWKVTMWLTNTTKDGVPIGSKVLVSQQLRDALLTPPLSPSSA